MNLAIVGIFYDGYSDMWEDFLILFRKYWSDCPYPLYIVNQVTDIDCEPYGVQVLHAGKEAEYSKKVQMAVDNIDADYFLFLLEDFFFSEYLSGDVLQPVINFMNEKKAKYYGFHLDLFVESRLKGIVREISPSDEYTVVSAYNIWKKDFLQQCIGHDNYNAWVFEGIYAKAPKVHTNEFLKGCYFDQQNTLCLVHGAIQGKFLPRTKKIFLEKGYNFQTNREVLDKKSCIKQRIKILLIDIMPMSMRNAIKKYFKSMSVTGKYAEEIDKEIKILNLD